MKNNNLDIDDITMDANSLKNAINGLDSFVFHNICNNDVKVEDISALSGLLVSIKLLAKKHAKELSDYGIGL
ncbi:hypothetical protein P7H60_11285 [Vagococcus carniphilus]|uniref:hypothetical protein n=1 Tax=Vagococcus carniphilus TaxID=218144 RepID=UPI002891805B|nr:hypothetical protein [Vagococcus carniphilus]MDT2849724.1 hypothetical protein [Vagococcus carniphilus]